eukprot:m.290454 g.290454  ORF g.290454 m.290454 type:complete len:175 (+) comp22950_c2_seq32:797-1321(+)
MPPCRCSLCEGAERATHTIAVHMRNEIKIRFVKMQKERQQEQQQEQQQQQQQAQQPTQPPAPEKPPVPPEHQPLVQGFEHTLKACLANNNPSYTKKLEDVSKRLDILTDKLRYHEVEVPVLQNLQGLCQYLSARDYQSALYYHQQLVSTSNPDQTAQYLNGLKVLINIAKALNC